MGAWFAVDRRELLVREGLNTGKLFTFEELKAGAAAGADVGDFVGYACLVDGAYAIASANDADSCSVGCYSVSDRVSAYGEGRKFEDPGGTVPEDGAGFGYVIGDKCDGFWTNVKALPVGGEVFGAIPSLGFSVGGEVVGEDVVDRKQEFYAVLFGFGQGFFGDVDLVFFNQRFAGGDTESALEGVGHATDDD